MQLFLFTIGNLDIRILDVLDIIIVAYLIYFVYKYIRGSAAVNIFIGVILFLILLAVVSTLKMRLLSLILGSIAGIGLIGILVIFQPEIRRFLLMIGNNTMKGRFSFFDKYLKKLGIENFTNSKSAFDIILKAVKSLSSKKTGALIVLTKTNLPALINTGQFLDCKLNVKILETIFNKNTPLHDGAVIIQGDRIMAASCILPVSSNDNFPTQAGLRHRAALGVSEGTENLTIVISEETGHISYTSNGKLFYNITNDELKIKLEQYYLYKLG
ncbi:MAG: TIGR00159 family protein [Saprospiraceae bacterium]|nr:diadenylate cyclase CdaA [Bacteroidia bacterium]NNE16404.1 TIGR00159 family protein [Saprospiraceae bacterium]NNL93492.1 TIGR00159 family protein [Saprospiraceae bacterium]